MALQRHFLLLLLATAILLTPLAAQAFIIVIPNCNLNPGHSFCDCRFNPGPWCAPPEPERDPIVLIPGITVSQNKKLLYKDEEGGKWKFAFGYNIYKGLIKKLESAGYEEGDDLLIAHYDWRNPAAHNATTYLKPIIDQAKQVTGASKVDVIAHSFGGVIARAYIQSDQYTNDIDQLITLGSPHEGSADSYVAWEGGLLPEGWPFLMRQRVKNIDKSLKESRGQKNIRPPESFRSFFPSLHDMLPLNDFVKKNDTLLAVTDLTEQNSWLKNLHDTFSDIAAKGINLATIAGTNITTLGQINITDQRTTEDEKLNRWRDGQPVTIPPPLDSTEGDARVLLSNAHVGEENITINNAVHHKLPDEAQDQVFELLGLEPEPSFFSTFPKKVLSVIILSPLEAMVEGPNGEILSLNQNDFGADTAEYDDDPDDPDDPIEINIADPPDGEYKITYTGTGEGEYTIITSYADEDENVASVQNGTTFTGQIFTETTTIGDATTSLIDDEDYIALLLEIKRLARQAKEDKLIKKHEQTKITRSVDHALKDLRHYEKELKHNHKPKTSKHLRSYYKHLDKIEKEVKKLSKHKHNKAAGLVDEILQLLDKISLNSPPL